MNVPCEWPISTTPRPLLCLRRYSRQASRFSQVCRVYAPVYRQQTLIGLAQGSSAESYQLAYGDVEEAWREYRARFNGGRGVVLIGHSQGTRMLRRLLRDEIDQRRAERRRLVSALLLGGQVTVRRDQLAGGDFQNVPVCAAHDQTGCVIAWSTFNETPPSNSRYGRPPAEDTSGFGFPTGDEYEIVCTNPASLGANERVPLSTYLRGEPFHGFIGLLLVEMYGGPQPSAETAWLQPQDHYTGRCEERDGANVLMLEPIGNARRLNPSHDPSWGLHLADGNIALGDLVATVNEQSTAFRRKRPRPGAKPPRLSLRVKGRRGPRRCLRGDARVSLHGKGIKRIRDVEFAVGRNVYARDVRAPFRVTVQGGRLAGAAIRRLRAFVHLRGRVNIALVRHVRICR